MSQPDLPKLPPPTRPVRSPMRRRARAKWWFDQMRREVDKAPEPKRVCKACGGAIEFDVPKDNHTCKGCQNV